jgi:hypothetical protein
MYLRGTGGGLETFKKSSKKMLTQGSESEKFSAHTEQLTTNMRTKTLLLSAAVLAAGVASTMAANVYSVNVVGYINVTVQPGYNLIANQLDVDGVDAVGTVLNAGTPSSQEGANILKFSNGGFSLDTYANNTGDVGFIGWYDGNLGSPSTTTISPGVGFFYFNPASSNVTLTLTGTVLQGTNSVALPVGYALISTVAPQAITLDTTATNNFPAGEGDVFLAFTGGAFSQNDTYAATTADVGFIGWYDSNTGNPASPTPAVGQGFFYFNGGSAKAWSRNFQVQ